MEISLVTLTILLVLFVLFFKWVTRNNYYFHDKPIPSLVPTFLLGNSSAMFTRSCSMPDFVQWLYSQFPDAKIFGMFDLTSPMYFIRDPELVKKIGIKDFDYFVDHTSILADAAEADTSLFGGSLVSLKGQKWRDMRATMSPAFTGSKMRLMFDLVTECSQNVAQYFLKQEGPIVNEMKELFSRFANDVIATAAFGIKVDSFRDKENDFYLMGKQLSNFQSLKVAFKFMIFRFFPRIAIALKVDLMDPKMTNYFKNMVIETMNIREAKGIIRPDMINILLELKKGQLEQSTHDEDLVEKEGFATVEESNVLKATKRTWSENEIIAQAFIFFVAGFETVSTCMEFVAHEIMVNPDVQQKLYLEIKQTEESLEGKKLSYDTLQKMKYLDMVVSEVLRMWSPAPITDRRTSKNYNYDDGAGTKFVIEKGKTIWFPIHSFHHDPKYFPNPEKFDPERFNDENKGNINLSTYLPFGIGPRNCIGSRFALMEVKAIIYYLLLNFSFEKTEKTQIPLKLQKTAFGMRTEKGVWVELKPRK